MADLANCRADPVWRANAVLYVGSRVPLAEVVRDNLRREHGPLAGAKLEQLKMSCADATGHGLAHPRVAVFRRLARFDETEAPWNGLQEAVCMALFGWLRIATDASLKNVATTRLLLPIRDISRLLDHMRVRSCACAFSDSTTCCCT